MKKTISITVISIILLSISMVIPVRVKNNNEAQNVKFWFPFKYITQDITAIEYQYPLKTHILSIRENPTRINTTELIFSLIFYYIVIFSAYIFLNKNKKDQKYFLVFF